MKKQAYINSIRQEYTGMRDMPRESLASSIKTLADDLYTKDTHFIFELIQNAEDNDYHLETRPKLGFEVRNLRVEGHEGAVLIVHNNETGFLEKHVRALCQVGRTTKNKTQGYIGEKGIGFKSVFRITSCPYVFSNGFEFCLPENDEQTGLGYIVPRWVSIPPEGIISNETTIILPINKNQKDLRAVVDALIDIAPETILFLQKLNSMEIFIHLPEIGMEYEVIIEKHIKEILGVSKLVELSYVCRKSDSNEETLDTLQYWLTDIDFAKPDDIHHEKRGGIGTRTVSVAIPLKNEDTGGKLFAYLPVWNNTGLPFLINADFLLVSSREGIKEDETWNKWLRSCVIEAYERSFISLLTATEISLEMKVCAYASIPLECHYSFLSVIINPIQQHLTNLDCIIVLPDQSLARPSKARLCDERVRSLLGSSSHFPDYLLNNVRISIPEIELFHNHLSAIGVKLFSLSEVLSCLDDHEWVLDHNLIWFTGLFQYLSTQKINKENLAHLNIIPVACAWRDFWLSMSLIGHIYFPLNKADQTVFNEVPSWLSEFLRMNILSSDFLCLVEQQQDPESLIKWMSDSLGVRKFSIEKYCIDVLDKLTYSHGDLDDSKLIEATKWLDQNAKTKIDWGTLPILLQDGSRVSLRHALPNNLVVPENFDQMSGWQHIWPRKEDRTHFAAMADGYSLMPADWFERLRIKKYPGFKKMQFRCSQVPSNRISERELASKCSRRAATSRSSETTISSVELPSSLMQPKYNENLLKSLSRSLLSYFNNEYERRSNEFGLLAKCTYHYYGQNTDYAPSALLEWFTNSPWLPSTKGYVRPSQAFLLKKGIQEILGDTVPYFSKVLPENVIKLLNIRSEVTVVELLGLLRTNSKSSDVDPNMAERVYSALSSRTVSEPQEIPAAFANESLILAKNTKNSIGWYKSNECVWEDAANILGDDFAYLQNQYTNLKGFFVERLGIKERADAECFAKRWLKLQSTPIKKKEKEHVLMERLYREIKPVALKPETERPSWWKDFANSVKLYAHSGNFCGPDEILLPDDGELKEIFMKQEEVELAWRPGKDSWSEWIHFYKAFKVPLLSESVTEHLAKDVDSSILKANYYVTESAIKMIGAWLRENKKDAYDRLCSEKAFTQLSLIREARTFADIRVEFRMETDTYVYDPITVEYPVFWDRVNNILIYQKEADKFLLAKALAKGLLKNYHEFSSWVELVLGAADTKRLKSLNWNVPLEILNLFRSEIIAPFEPEGRQSPTDSKVAERLSEMICNSSAAEQPICEAKATPLILKDTGSKVAPSSTSLMRPAVNRPETEEGGPAEFEDSLPSYEHEGDLTDTSHARVELDYGAELVKAFHRDGYKQLNEDQQSRASLSDDGEVMNPNRRNEKLKDGYSKNIQNEPSPRNRRRITERLLLEGPNEAVRISLYEWYHGKCQICGETWPKKDGDPFFAAAYLVERHHARWIDEIANAICLCAKHFAQWRHAAKQETSDIIEQILGLRLKAEGGNGDLSIRFRMFENNYAISYNERHLLALRTLVEVSKSQ